MLFNHTLKPRDLKTSELNYFLPDHLVATEPQHPPRVMSVNSNGPAEITWKDLLSLLPPQDLLLINNTQVIPRRVWAETGEEILFLDHTEFEWRALLPCQHLKVGSVLNLPGGVRATLQEKGMPQKLYLSQPLENIYFSEFGEMALPPYIQKLRSDRHSFKSDKTDYQNPFGYIPGSVAAPTASLHFKTSDMDFMKARGVIVEEVSLHVGMGTFLPVKTENLNDHQMHTEFFSVSKACLQQIENVKKNNGHVWALGTTVVRAIESVYTGLNINAAPDGSVYGQTDIFIKPGYKFKCVDHLLTNFHQPQSTLLALVYAHSGIEKVKSSYQWAIENKFRFLSYGDLSVWSK